MSDDAGDTTTWAPPPSYRRQRSQSGLSIVSSSQLSPRSPPSRNTWGEPGEERNDRRRRSNVTFSGQTSVAPSSSISKRAPPATRTTQSGSASGTQYSRSTRRRSAPRQDVEYRSTYPSKAASSQGGTARSGDPAPLTATNLELFTERQPARSEADTQRDVERDVDVEQKSIRRPRRDSGVVTQEPPSNARSMGGETKRSTRQYSQAGYQSSPPSGQRTVATTRRRTVVEDDEYDEDVRSRSKSGYASYSRPTLSSRSKSSTKVTTRAPRASNVYAQAAERRQSRSSVTGSNSQSQSPWTQRSRPPTMPPDNDSRASTSRDLGAGAIGGAAAEEYEERTRQTDVKSKRFSSQRDEERTRQTEIDSERAASQRETRTERQSTAASSTTTTQTNRQSRAPSRLNQPTSVAAATSPNAPSQSPTSTTSPTSPTSATSPTEPYWERRVRIIETIKPDGRSIEDREISMRRVRPQAVGA